MNTAETTISITDSNSQTIQQKDIQDKQHNTAAVVVDTEKEKIETLQVLGKLGISYLRAQELIETHGQKRIAEVTRHVQDQKCMNPAGYLIRALKENWTIGSTTEQDYAYGNGMTYITGKYADFIHH